MVRPEGELIISGKGTDDAKNAATVAVSKLKADPIINIGIATALTSDFEKNIIHETVNYGDPDKHVSAISPAKDAGRRQFALTVTVRHHQTTN